MKMSGSVTRVLLKITFVLALIVILIPVGLILFLEPNNYKADIQRFVATKTGYDVNIKGDIAVTWYPWLGLNANDLAIKAQASDEKELVKIQQLNFKIPIKRLLNKELTLDAISIDGLSLHLETDNNGQLAWQAPKTSPQEAIKNLPSEKPKAEELKQAKEQTKVVALPIKTAKLTNSTITYQDNKSKTLTTFSNVDLTLTNLLPDTDTPLRMTFDFKHQALNGKTPSHNGQSEIATTLKNKLANPLFDRLNLSVKWEDVQNKQSHEFTAVSDVILVPNQKVTIEKMNAKLNESPIKGSMTLPLTQAPISFELDIDHLDLNQWIETASSDAKSNIKLTAQSPQKTQFPDAKGKIKFNKLRYDKVTGQNVSVNVDLKNNLLNLNPITATLHKGQLKAQVSKKLEEGSTTKLQGHLEHVDMLSLLSTYTAMDQVQGQGDILFNLLLSNNQLYGDASLKVQQGLIRGFDLDYYYEVIDNFVNRKAAPKQRANGDTRFNQLTASFQINENIINNPDLVITADDHKVTGKGTFNTTRSYIDYDLVAIRLDNDNRFKKTLPLAIEVKGPISRPTISPDIKKYAEMLMAQEGQRFIEKGLKKLLGDDAEGGAGSADSGDAGQDSPTLEDEITDGIKKIFKF